MSTSTANAPVSDKVLDEGKNAPAEGAAPQAQPAIEAEMLIEEISIDGMCGVY